jgi:hypothetical protein
MISQWTRDQGGKRYKYEFICGFIALVQHTCHTDIQTYRPPGVSVTMFRTPHPRAQVRESDVIELDGTHTWSQLHVRVAILQFCSMTLKVNVSLSMMVSL